MRSSNSENMQPTQDTIHALFSPLKTLKELIMDIREDARSMLPADLNIVIRSKKSDTSEACPVAMLGLPSSGKTTILYREKLGEIVTTCPTIGFNVETLNYYASALALTVSDVGGRLTAMWGYYFLPDSRALVWVVDAADRGRLAESRHELHSIVSNNHKALVLVLANKCDLDNVMTLREIVDGLDLAVLGNPYIVHKCSALTGQGVSAGLSMLAEQLADLNQKPHPPAASKVSCGRVD